MRTGALKGIAFLYFRAGDVAAAVDHLQRAAEADPDDITIAQALARVRRESRVTPGASAPEPSVEEPPALETVAAVPAAPIAEPPVQAPPPVPEPRPVAAGLPPVPDEAGSPFAAIEGGRSVVLVDANGLLLAGSLTMPGGGESGVRVAAELAGVSREASRAGRLLGLGQWHSITLECPDAHFVLVQPTADTVLLTAREPSLPVARVALVAERAAREARTWLERVQ
jgi:predicted regulator of Ras-like GTPase activity (Roadblock/LC7/MglB family)